MSTEPRLLETFGYVLFCAVGLVFLAWAFNAWWALGPTVLAILLILFWKGQT